jgi:phosphoribosylformylglycinamidine synthase
MPVAHAEGKLVTADKTTLQALIDNRQVAVRYCDPDGNPPAGYPADPNGSDDHIAGLTDRTGRILGLMPHPERHVQTTQHPHWTRRPDARADGRAIFESAVEAAKQL